MSEPAGVLYVIDELLQLGGAERNLVRTIHHLPRDRFRPSLLTFRLNREVEDFRTLPCPVEVYPVSLYSPNALRYAPRLVQWIRSEQIRIVHTFFEMADVWAGGLAKVGSDAVVISSRRDLGIQRNWRLNMLYRMVGGMFDQVQTVSRQVRDYVIETDKMDPADVVTVPNSIDLERVPVRGSGAEFRRRLNLPEGRPLIVTLANIRRVKGLDVLVRAASVVCRRRPEALFLVAGWVSDEPYQAELNRLARDLGVADNVRFIGPIENPLGLLSECDAFFLPSRSEGMSNALLEAMACALPSVATSVGGNCQLVQQGRTGFLVPTEDSDAAAARLLELLDHPALARTMGQEARLLIEEHYSIDAVIQQLTRQYDTLLGRP